jgi:hypothetical protein
VAIAGRDIGQCLQPLDDAACEGAALDLQRGDDRRVDFLGFDLVDVLLRVLAFNLERGLGENGELPWRCAPSGRAL